MTAYYNENDRFAAAWLRNLISENLIAPGDVDERSIEEVQADDLKGYTQCHFFAGIGVWSYALRTAGWSDDLPAWTGSCPCQSFSASGARGGFSDKRHLWPAWFRLIRECQPIAIFGEQVASKDGRAWFDVVSTDLEGSAYTVGACDLPACGFGAPHIRNRLYFVARMGNSNGTAREAWNIEQVGAEQRSELLAQSSASNFVAHAQGVGREHGILERGASAEGILQTRSGNQSADNGADDFVAQSAGARPSPQQIEQAGTTNGYWRNAIWIPCKDGTLRPVPVEQSFFPLASRITNRVGKLRGYGNSLTAPVATAFIQAYLETLKR